MLYRQITGMYNKDKNTEMGEDNQQGNILLFGQTVHVAWIGRDCIIVAIFIICRSHARLLCLAFICVVLASGGKQGPPSGLLATGTTPPESQIMLKTILLGSI